MDANRFETLLRSLATSPSRRGALRLLAGSALGGLTLGGPRTLLELTETEAKRKKGKKRKRHQDDATIPPSLPPSPSSSPPPPPPVCTPSCTGGRICQAGGVCACPSGTRGCFNGNCGACCSNFDCCTPPDGQFTCPPGSQTCLDTIPRVCGYSCTDGVRNGTESDIDCGGDCSRCANGKRCNTHQDCASSKCGAGRCVECLTTADCQGTQTCLDGTCGYGGGSGGGGGGGDSS